MTHRWKPCPFTSSCAGLEKNPPKTQHIIHLLWTCIHNSHMQVDLLNLFKHFSFLTSMLLQMHAVSHPAAAALKDSVPGRSNMWATHYLLLSWQAHSTSGAAVLASHNKMSHSNKKCWQAYFFLPLSVQEKKQPFSAKLLCCIFSLLKYFCGCWIFLGGRFRLFKLIHKWFGSRLHHWCEGHE